MIALAAASISAVLSTIAIALAVDEERSWLVEVEDVALVFWSTRTAESKMDLSVIVLLMQNVFTSSVLVRVLRRTESTCRRVSWSCMGISTLCKFCSNPLLCIPPALLHFRQK